MNNLKNEELFNNSENFLKIEKNDLFSFDKLKGSLLKAKENIDNYFYKINMELKEEKEKTDNFENKYSEINSFLKNIYHQLYDEINKEKYFELNENIKNECSDENLFYFSHIEYIIDNPNRAYEIGISSRKVYERYFTIEHFQAELRNIMQWMNPC